MNGAIRWLAVAAIGVAGAGELRAQVPESNALGQLDQQVRILARKLELAEEAAAASAKETPVLTAGKDGFTLSSADKAFQLKLRGYLQADGRFFPDDRAKLLVDTFVVRRARLIFEGKLGQPIEFRVAPEFGNGKTELLDGYLDYKPRGAVNLRFGRTKVPFGLERLQSSADTLFVETGLPTALTPNYDVGAMLYGALCGGAVDYALGVFNGGPDGTSVDADTNDGKDLAARVVLTPFKRGGPGFLSGLSLGVAGTFGRQEGNDAAPGLPSYRTSGQQTLFAYRTSTNKADTAFADGDRTRLAAQLYDVVGSLGVLGEYTVTAQDVANGKGADTLHSTAWQVAASYVLTGESPSLKSVAPLRPYAPAKGQWGAVEVAARAGELTVDGAAFDGGWADAKKSAESARAWGVGVNWYLTRNAKFQVNYEQTAFDGGAADGDRPDEHAVLARAQVAW